MNINWPKLIGVIVAIVVGLFWAIMLLAMLTGCEIFEQRAEADVLYCVGVCAFADVNSIQTGEGRVPLDPNQIKVIVEKANE